MQTLGTGPEEPAPISSFYLSYQSMDHTKKPNPKRPAKAERVSIIAAMMAKGEWYTGRSAYALAEKWSMNPKVVSADAGEASRKIKDIVAADPELIDQLKCNLAWATETAKQLVEEYRQRDPKAAVNAVKAYSEACRVLVAGAQSWARAEAENRGAAEPAQYRDLSDEDLAAALKK